MLSAEARSRLAVVLVGARNPQNIGAAARAMQDFGFSDLRVVNTFAPPFEAAQLEARSAVGAGELMRSARLFASLSEAIRDCTHVVGTTAIGERGLAHAVRPIRDTAAEALERLNSSSPGAGSDGQEVSRLALLFGSEKTGLTNEQLSYCHSLTTIPMYQPETRHLSMNLGQSVAVCLYEFTREGFEGSREIPVTTKIGATTADRERLLALVLSVMEESGYARRFPANARPEIVRQLTLQLGNTRDEATTWTGFFRQLLRRLEPGTDGNASGAGENTPKRKEPTAGALGS